ncbi:MAG: peptide MFS transporter [Elusimicrobium sp.]|jgi:POT family proton-dependent oligopeptide transporter|nr:peptide MFS transporter [Elusimicrobium sp.]
MDTSMAKQKHPRALYMLFMVEMWERFNYYGMRALLTLFMISSVIGFDKPQAFKIYGWFTALVYLTPVVGGHLADKYIGKRHSITIGAVLMMMGQFTLAAYGFMPARAALFAGLTLIVLGNGFFKPNISSIVGELYEPNDPRRDGGFTIFYMGINVGAFFAPFITGFLGEQSRATAPAWVQWRYGFMAAGVGMLIGLIWYLVSQKKYLGDIGLRPVSKSTAPNAAELNKPLTPEDKDKLKAIFTFTFIAIFFFAFFEQAGSSLSTFADESIRRIITLPFIGRFEVPASWFQSVNPVAIVILAPLFAKMWINMAAKGKEPSTPVKFGWGVFLTGVGFLVLALGALFLTSGPINMMWLMALYVIHTTGELCLSPVGLSMVTKLAPAKLMAVMMGVWLTSSFFGNLMGGYFAELSETLSKPVFLAMPGVILLVFGISVWIFSGKIRAWMHGVR